MRWLTLATLLLAAGCSDECHDIGCGGTLIVELAPEAGFADGAYEVSLDSELGSTTCTFVIDGESASALDCTPGGPSLDASELPTYMLVRYASESPESLHVVVMQDGDEVANEDLTPEYEDVVIDPHACGGACPAAQVSVAF